MIFAVDIGNSNIVMSMWNGTWTVPCRIHTKTERTADEFFLLLTSLFSKEQARSCNTVIISSVVPHLVSAVTQGIHRFFECPVMQVHSAMNTPLQGAIPQELGQDLFANAVAAQVKSKGTASIVVDFGTALTFTGIHTSGTIAGVAISPGVHTALRTLTHNTALLKDIPLAIPTSSLGKNTAEALNSGIMIGYTHLVCGLVETIKRDIGEKTTVYATGGDAYLIAQSCNVFDEIDVYHTLEGLRILAEMNGENAHR